MFSTKYDFPLTVSLLQLHSAQFNNELHHLNMAFFRHQKGLAPLYICGFGGAVFVGIYAIRCVLCFVFVFGCVYALGCLLFPLF